MKVARILLLTLLALVLPLRGALAGIACCAGDLAELEQAVAQVHGHPGEAHGDAAHAHHHDHGDAAAEPGDTHGASGPYDKCHACTASCSAVSLIGALPVIPTPPAAAGVVFPALSAPPPSHASEGQERPPRSC